MSPIVAITWHMILAVFRSKKFMHTQAIMLKGTIVSVETPYMYIRNSNPIHVEYHFRLVTSVIKERPKQLIKATIIEIR